MIDRSNGPWDAAETEVPEAAIDLGGVRLPPLDGVEIQVQVDQASGSVISVTAMRDGAAAAINAYAAPKTAGMWDEVRNDIVSSLTNDNTPVTEQDGTFGPELITTVQTNGPDGQTLMQPARFIGIDGPRWFLRVVLFGSAVEGDTLDDVVRGIIVNRGSDAMAPGTPLPLVLPDQAATAETPSGRPPLNPFERGPEITEIR